MLEGGNRRQLQSSQIATTNANTRDFDTTHSYALQRFATALIHGSSRRPKLTVMSLGPSLEYKPAR